MKVVEFANSVDFIMPTSFESTLLKIKSVSDGLDEVLQVSILCISCTDVSNNDS